MHIKNFRGKHGEYRLKLRRIDEVYNGTGAGEIGPCVARLDTMGDILALVVGAFGEASTDLERVIVAMAESRVLYLSRAFQLLEYQWGEGRFDKQTSSSPPPPPLCQVYD